MSVTESGNITAILKLETTEFNNSIEKANTLVGNFEKNLIKAGKNSAVMEMGTQSMTNALNALIPSLNDFNNLTSKVSNFNKFANGINKIALGLAELGKESVNAEQSINVMNNLMKNWQNTVTGTEIKIKGLKVSNLELANSANTAQNRYAAWNQTLANSRMSWVSADNTLMTLGKNIQNFNNVVTGADSKVKQFNTTLDSSKSKINSYRIAFTESANSATRFSTSLSSLNATLVNTTQRQANMGNALRNTTTSLNTTSSATSRLSTSYGVLDGKINSTVGKTQQLTTANNTLSSSKQRVSSSSSNASSSISKVGSSASSATGQVNKLATANSRLAKTMSSLKMMGSLVGSMLAYNFAHKLFVATGETIHAKSEMEGYFKMLNFGQRDINSFNQALDRTVQQFQRVNKYSLGETISSIGVEFNLSTKEMEKAMKVTSMVTSEYLRAGRNANEASLAVKDVLQGQFQRLSRETGVKGEQLKEAGWSGDTTDVLSLMEALEKVGESRHWDVFASKANSLNDILTITQNRFGEWSADLAYDVQPLVVNAFNMMMGTFDKFTNVAGAAVEWLKGDSIEAQVAKWALLGTTLTTVTGLLISYRTGAGLVQVAQMGLTNSLAATVFGLEAETVATYGSRTAIMSKLFGLEAEKVAELSTRDAILSKILGLDAEVVAQEGLKSALLTSSFARELEQLQIAGATEEEIANTFALYQNQLAQRSSITLLAAQALGLNMTTLANEGFTVALLESTTALEAGSIAAMSLTEQILLLGVSVAAPIAVVGAFAVAFGNLALEMYNSAEEMKRFNELVSKGTDTIKENRKILNSYISKQDALKKKLSETKEGTKEYYQIQDQLRGVNRDITTSNYNLANSIKAVEIASSSQKHFEEGKTDLLTKKQGELAEAYMKAGYSMSESYEIANDSYSLIDAQNGAEQLRQTLNGLAMFDYKHLQATTEMLDVFNEANFDSDKAKQYVKQINSYQAMISQGYEKGRTDESFFGRLDGWLTYYEGQIGKWYTQVTAYFDAGNWSKAFENIWKGIAHGFADLPLFKDFWGWVYDQLGVDNYKGQGWDAFGNIFSDIFNSNQLVQAATIWFESLAQIFEDPIGALGITLSEFDIWKLLGFDAVSAADGSETPSFMEDLSNILGFNIQTWLDSFSADPLGTLGVTGGAIDLYNFFSGLITSNIEGISLWVDENIVQPLSTGISNGIANIPILGDIAQLLGLIPNENQDASNKGDGLGDSIGSGLTTAIGNIPILGNILKALGVIPQANPTARSHGKGVGDNASQGYFSGTSNLVSQAVQEFQDIADGIRKKVGEAFSAAQAYGKSMWDGLNSVMQRASPGFFHDQTLLEFGTDIPNAIRTSADTAYSDAQYYGSMIKQGIADSGTTTIGMDGMVADYQSDAQIISDSSQLMGITTSTAFNDMQRSVNTSTSQMASNVNTQYTSMQQKQASLLNNMKTSNTTAYNEMYQKSNTSLLHMRDSTSNITHQMTNAWNTMKNNIVESAHKLKTDSTVHFNTLSNTIGSFYRKIQNPSSWGSAGSPKFSSGKRNTSAGKMFTSSIKHAAGGWTGRDTMTISALKRKLCPNGDCDGIFDNFKSSDVVNVSDFLSLMIPEGHGFGGWSFNNSHYNYIKNTSDKWGMKSPTINLKGGIPTNADYKVADFENGTPKISFSSFQSMAESIFSAIPYRFYYDSDWKGSWLGALQAGACNCWDGAHALVAFANSCGFNGGVQHGTWVDPDGTTYPHVYAVINGKKMDTTGWQQRRSWSAGSPNTRSSNINNVKSNNNNTPVNINVTIEGDVYGVDDLDNKIADGVDKGLQRHFNKSYAIGI